MAAVPITFHGILYPKDKSVAPYPFTAVGLASITGLGVGGGPILPPGTPIDPPVEPPLEIWPGPGDPDWGAGPRPEHPIVIPPDLPPEQPPATPGPVHEGWNWKPSTPNSPEAGWYYVYVPSHQGAAGPRGRK